MTTRDEDTASFSGDQRSDDDAEQVSRDATPVATPDPLLTRRQAARELGKHVSTVRRLERKAVLQPVRGDDGVHRFPESQVRALRRGERDRDAPARRSPDAFDDGATTAAVFELFAAGVASVDVVVRLKLPAAAVDALFQRWVGMRGAFVVSRDAARQLSALRGVSILDELALLQSVQDALPNTNLVGRL